VTTGGYINTNETYLWNFPGANPNTSAQKNPTISYPDTGTYNVSLIVNRGGQIDSLTKSSYIKVTPGGVGIQNSTDKDKVIKKFVVN
jgi:PKD repeat protein